MGSHHTDVPEPQKFAALYLDVPNIRHVKQDNGEIKVYSIREVDWAALIDRMLDSLAAANYTYIGTAYMSVQSRRKSDHDYVQEIFKKALATHRNDLMVTVRYEKDIDSMIVNDMWQHFHELVQMQYRSGKPFSSEVTFLLAGGDGVYASPVKSIRQTFPDTRSQMLRLHTFSWKNSLSHELTCVSDYFEYLEDGESIVLSPGTFLTGKK